MKNKTSLRLKKISLQYQFLKAELEEIHFDREEYLDKFDEEFIELARAVYYTNDRRAAEKKEINHLLNSEFFEEKIYQKYD